MMANCYRCGTDLGPLTLGYCRTCTEALSGHKIPERIECATCSGTGKWAGGRACEDCQGRGWFSTEDWK